MLQRAFNASYRLAGDSRDRHMPVIADTSFDALDQLMERHGEQLARAVVNPQASGIVRADHAPPVPVPPGHRGRFIIPHTGRLVWWTGRVAIGLRYEPAANTDLGVCAEQVQNVLLGNRKAA